MNTSCETFEALLLEGDAASLESAARHTADCSGCARQLADWNEISATAQSLRTSWNSDLLWPRIERELRRQNEPRTRTWQIAAAVVLTVLLGGGTWFAVRQRTEQRAFENTILREQAVAQVESAERAHIEAIEQLERAAGPRLADAGSPLMVSYKEKLMLLDDAINECQTNIQHNRQNAHLRKQLLAVYSEKQRTLQDVLREENRNVSNQ